MDCTLNYSFNGTSGTAIVPETTTVQTGIRYIGNYQPNYNPEGYQITFYSTNNRRILQLTVREWRYYTYLDWSILRHVLSYRSCSGSWANVECLPDASDLTTNYSIKCSTRENPPTECWLKAYNNNILIVNVTGQCPVTYSLDCGCPENSLDCGDCCLDCDDTFNQISEIRSLLSRIK